jgi:rhodanese-related sulfurtransferase
MSSSLSAPELEAHLLQSRPLLLDVREPWEFEICHIDGSTNIPMGQIPQRLQELPDDGEMVVICHHGVRSQQVIHFLRPQTSLRLINLDGGVDAWARSVDRDMPVY